MRPRRSTEAKSRKKGISKDGVALTEFALVAMVFFILFFGIIDFCRLMFMYHHVSNAAREGTRYAIVHGSTSLAPASDVDVRDEIKKNTAFDADKVSVTTTWPDGNNAPGSKVIVRVDYPFTFTLPILFGSGIPLTSTSQMLISY